MGGHVFYMHLWVLQHMQHTVMILSFRTDVPGQTVQTQIRLSSLIRVYTVCHSVCIVWTHYFMVEPHSSNFRVITRNFWGVRIFRKFTVKSLLHWARSCENVSYVICEPQRCRSACTSAQSDNTFLVRCLDSIIMICILQESS